MLLANCFVGCSGGTLNERRALNFPIVPHHVVEVDVLLDHRTVAHVIVHELLLGNALTLPVAVHGVVVRSAVSKVVDEILQHLPTRPIAVCELGMRDVVERHLHMTVTEPKIRLRITY